MQSHLTEKFNKQLSLAAEKGDIKAMEQAIQKGANVNCTAGFEGEPPLITAIEKGNTKAVKLLLEKGANVNQVDGFGRNSLMAALTSNFNEDIIQMLLNKNCIDLQYQLHGPGGNTVFDILENKIKNETNVDKQNEINRIKNMLIANDMTRGLVTTHKSSDSKSQQPEAPKAKESSTAFLLHQTSPLASQEKKNHKTLKSKVAKNSGNKLTNATLASKYNNKTPLLSGLNDSNDLNDQHHSKCSIM